MRIFKDKSGLVLAEALVAITVLAICTVAAGSLVNYGVRTMIFSKNRVVARNIATEVAEAVKSVRNTNWLVQADDPGCWLELVPDEGVGCAIEVEVGDHYISERAMGGGWKLTEIPGVLDLSDSYDDESFRLDVDSIFYREIAVSALVDVESDGIDDYVEFEVLVEWKEGQKIRSLARNVILYNYNQ